MKDDLEVKYVEFENIITGNLSHLKFMFVYKKYLINCVYAPNEDFNNDDTKRIFKDVFNDSYFQDYNHIMYVGDFNVALNHELDTSRYLHIYNPQFRQYIKGRMATNKIIDIWPE